MLHRVSKLSVYGALSALVFDFYKTSRGKDGSMVLF